MSLSTTLENEVKQYFQLFWDVSSSRSLESIKSHSLYEELVDLYNNNINVLSAYIVAKVFLSINDKQVIFKKAVSYDYLVVDGEDDNYWLVPREDIKIHFSKYQELQNLFDCGSYNENYSSFILAKPAKVSAILEQIHWHLEERGKIIFV